MKRLASILLLLVLLLQVAACGSENGGADTTDDSTQAENEAGQPDSEDGGAGAGDSGMSVCLIVELLGDNAINDFCYEGAKRAADDFGVELKVLECEDTSQYEPQLLSACEGDYDLILCSASPWADYLAQHAPNYPDKQFAILDDIVDEPNVVSVGFANNQGSFLAGAAAAMLTTMDDVSGINADKVVGWVGSKDMPVLWDFYVGFEQGVKYVDEDMQVLQSFAGSSTDPLKGKELALAQYAAGADIVMAVAAATGNGVLEAAADEGLYAIGVDLDQDADQPGHVLTSMVKRSDNACYALIESIVDGTYAGGAYIYMDLSNGGVTLTDMSVIRENMTADEAARIDEILDEVEELEGKIVSGEIVVENYEGFGPRD